MTTATEYERRAVTVGWFGIGSAIGVVIGTVTVGGLYTPSIIALAAGFIASFVAHRVQR